jgi:hypothetical protein
LAGSAGWLSLAVAHEAVVRWWLGLESPWNLLYFRVWYLN